MTVSERLALAVDNQAMNTTVFSREPEAPVRMQDLDPGGLNDLLGYQLARASIMTNANFQATVGKPWDVTKVEFTMLQLVKQNPGVTSSRLAQAMAISMPAVTVAMAKLEQRGWVSRARSTVDRRAQHFEVTPEGRTQITLAMQAVLAADARTLESLSLAERLMLLELLRKVGALYPQGDTAADAASEPDLSRSVKD